MRAFLFLLLLFPLVELAVLIKVGSVIGVGWTLFLIVASAFIGAALLRVAGVATAWRARERLARGELPEQEMLEGLLIAVGGGLLMLIFLILMVRDGRAGPEPPVRPADGMAHPPAGSLTEIVLLNEEDQALSSWTLYGKTGMVIGRDSGENQVNINLANSTYAGTVDVEHAVLNYSAGSWYVEDLNSKNGVSVQKGDKRKYKLAPGHPCLLARGDILYIGLVRLMIR